MTEWHSSKYGVSAYTDKGHDFDVGFKRDLESVFCLRFNTEIIEWINKEYSYYNWYYSSGPVRQTVGLPGYRFRQVRLDTTELVDFNPDDYIVFVKNPAEASLEEFLRDFCDFVVGLDNGKAPAEIYLWGIVAKMCNISQGAYEIQWTARMKIMNDQEPDQDE